MNPHFVYLEDEHSKFFRNAGNYLPNYTASQKNHNHITDDPEGLETFTIIFLLLTFNLQFVLHQAESTVLLCNILN
jgi:hypothetical protein